LQSAEGRAEAAGKHQSGDDCGPTEIGGEELPQAGAFEGAGFLLGLPGWGFGEKWTNDDQRKGRDESGHQRVPPRGVAIETERVADGEPVEQRNRRERVGIAGRDSEGDRHQQSADRGERLRVAEDPLAAFPLGEEFCQPRDRGDKLDTDADEDEAPEREEHPDVGGKPRKKRRERINQDAPGKHPPPPETVGQITADEPDQSTGEGRDEEQPTDPHVKFRVAGHNRWAEQFLQCRPRDQREHQQFVDVERKPD